jgi:hypothetical protein
VSPELLVSLASLALNVVVVPAVALLWNHERRITRVETKLNLRPLDS